MNTPSQIPTSPVKTDDLTTPPPPSVDDKKAPFTPAKGNDEVMSQPQQKAS